MEARQLGIVVTPCILVSASDRVHISALVVTVRKAFTPAMVASLAAAKQSAECEIGVIIESVEGCLAAGELVVSGPMYLDCVAFDTDRIAEDLFGETGNGEEDGGGTIPPQTLVSGHSVCQLALVLNYFTVCSRTTGAPTCSCATRSALAA